MLAHCCRSLRDVERRGSAGRRPTEDAVSSRCFGGLSGRRGCARRRAAAGRHPLRAVKMMGGTVVLHENMPEGHCRRDRPAFRQREPEPAKRPVVVTPDEAAAKVADAIVRDVRAAGLVPFLVNDGRTVIGRRHVIEDGTGQGNLLSGRERASGRVVAKGSRLPRIRRRENAAPAPRHGGGRTFVRACNARETGEGNRQKPDQAQWRSPRHPGMFAQPPMAGKCSEPGRLPGLAPSGEAVTGVNPVTSIRLAARPVVRRQPALRAAPAARSAPASLRSAARQSLRPPRPCGSVFSAHAGPGTASAAECSSA